MKIICAWCKKVMGEKAPLKDKRMTHGMCDECFKRIFGKEPPVIYEIKEEVRP